MSDSSGGSGQMKAHLFICVNDRGPGGKQSCAQRGGASLKDKVKDLCREMDLPKGSYRINNSGCLGPCERGITAVLYPQGQWIYDQLPRDAEALAALVEKTVKG